MRLYKALPWWQLRETILNDVPKNTDLYANPITALEVARKERPHDRLYFLIVDDPRLHMNGVGSTVAPLEGMVFVTNNVFELTKKNLDVRVPFDVLNPMQKNHEPKKQDYVWG
jgi:hypothetical protein